MKNSRRHFVTGTVALALGSAAARLGAQPRSIRVRVGYLPVIPSDAHIWLGEHLGIWKEQGLEMNFVRFNSGPEQFQAMVGGSIDVLSAGAALANFPARGQGKVFLAGFLERASTELWVNPARGIKSIADLKGKSISTTRGTTAELMLGLALAREKLEIGKDVEVVNQRMPDAVSAFIAGSVPAVATWVPFDVQIRAKMPEARKLTDAGQYLPASAVLDGWAASNEFHQNNREALIRLVRGWVKANEYLVTRRGEALAMLHKEKYANLSRAEVDSMINALDVYDTAQWRRLYQDGTVAGWLNQTTDFFAKSGNLKDVLKADRYFDPSLFLEATR